MVTPETWADSPFTLLVDMMFSTESMGFGGWIYDVWIIKWINNNNNNNNNNDNNNNKCIYTVP